MCFFSIVLNPEMVFVSLSVSVSSFQSVTLLATKYFSVIFSLVSLAINFPFPNFSNFSANIFGFEKINIFHNSIRVWNSTNSLAVNQLHAIISF